MTEQRYLRISYRHGQAFAGYLYFPRRAGDRVDYSQPVGDDFVVDFTADDRAIGVEILSPATATAKAINDVLAQFGQEPMAREELAPLAEKATA